MPVKVVFLDIDGVLNSCRSVVVKVGPTVETSALVRELAQLDAADHDLASDLANGLEYGVRFGLLTADPVCVALLNKLLAGQEVALVLSSTHRKHFNHSRVLYGSDEHLRRLRLYLTAMGVVVPQVFGVTPVLHRPRGEEIQQWLDQALESGLMLDGDPYVILDDAADMLPGQSLVLCDAEHGFSFANYAQACKLLGFKEPGLVLL